MIYVIGKNGYVGSNLIKYFADKGIEARGMGRDDLTDHPTAGDVIINCAAYGVKSGQKDIRFMVLDNTLMPIGWQKNYKSKFIQMSSSSEIFQPTTAYARTKSLASDYLRGKATLCYIYTAWGGINQHPHQFMTALLKCKREGTAMHLTTPYATRDFVHIEHICRGIEELIHKPIGEYHFGMGIAWEMAVVARMAGVDFSVPEEDTPSGFEWRATEPYFEDAFEEDLKEEMCE